MAITHSDRISGTIYVIAIDAASAQEAAMDHLRGDSFNVFDTQEDADQALRDAFRSREVRDRVYAVSLDIRAIDQ